MQTPNAKKLILLLGSAAANASESLRETVTAALRPLGVVPQFVPSKDGMDASLKVANQKFDVVVVDTQVARLAECGFLRSRRSRGSTTDLIALHPAGNGSLPEIVADAEQVLDQPCDADTLGRALIRSLSHGHRVSPATGEARFSVDVRVLNALLKATLFIGQQYGLSDLKVTEPKVIPAQDPWKGELAGSIEIKSQAFQGAFIISFDRAVYLKMVSTMLMEDQSDLNDENREAIGELTNMILGNAKAEFTQYQIEMTLPKILKPAEKIPCPSGSAAMVIPCHTAAGNVYVEVLAYPKAA